MAGLRVERPPEFSDDERWWGFFTRKSLLVALVSVGVSIVLTKFLGTFELTVLGIIISMFIVVVSIGLVIIPVPGNDVLHGSKLKLDIMIFYLTVRKKKACIYCKRHEPMDGG